MYVNYIWIHNVAKLSLLKIIFYEFGSLNSWQKQLDWGASGRALSFYKWVRFLNRNRVIYMLLSKIIIYNVLLVKININLHMYM